MEIDKKLFDLIYQKYEDHLKQEGNERILYSGKFGVGKSTFLRYYFQENKDKYNCIHLYPVNYSILSNEDIFTYLKFDILFDLITNKDVILQKAIKYDFDVALPDFVKNNWFKFLTLIPLIFDKIGGIVPGRGISELLKGCQQLINDYKEFVNPEDGDYDEFQKFQYDIFNKEGGLYESNALTNIIRTELANLKSGNNNIKENVLIIDDLDRLDPDHIFRLLNVFSAHFDDRNRHNDETSTNKYGFDKIILVCDNENIRNIFKARYGIDTDYNGYIDKFYSKEIFEHRMIDLTEIFTKQVFKFLYTNDQNINYGEINEKSTMYFHSILSNLLHQNLINLRTILKFSTESIDLRKNKIYYDEKNKITRHSFKAIVILDILSKIFGNKQNLLAIIGKLNDNLIENNIGIENQVKSIILAELICLNGKNIENWNPTQNRESKAKYIYDGVEYELYLKKLSDRSTLIYLEYDIVPSINLNFISLFKKFALEKYEVY